MKKNYWIILPLLSQGLGWLLTAGGCDIRMPDWHHAKYERTVQQQVPLAPGATIVTETSFGFITVVGADVTDCNVTAKIFVKAPTEQEAREIAEQVQIQLEPTDKTLKVTVEKPQVQRNRSIGVSFDIVVPKQTNIECSSSYGAIELTNLNGNVNGKTSNGSIKSQNIQGSAQLETSYGSITCKDVAGDSIRLKSASGSIDAENIRGLPKAGLIQSRASPWASLNTSYGSITCKAASGDDIELRSSSGKITLTKASVGDCNVHTSYGSISANELSANLLKLKSGSGNISVTKASANTTDISTSYGRITCQQITSTDLTAKSGSGNIDIAYPEQAPAEITANVETSYGSIDFVTPPSFSGQVELSTSYGSIKTDLPITITGEVSKKKLSGTIGEGKGKLHLRTSSGSIKIR